VRNLTLTLVLLSGPALAENNFCAKVGSIVEYGMIARLSGDPFSTTLGRLNEEFQDLEAEMRHYCISNQCKYEGRFSVEQIALDITTDIYKTPHSSGKENKQIAAVEYRNKVELECYN
jgi:hypothetical protein